MQLYVLTTLQIVQIILFRQKLVVNDAIDRNSALNLTFLKEQKYKHIVLSQCHYLILKKECVVNFSIWNATRHDKLCECDRSASASSIAAGDGAGERGLTDGLANDGPHDRATLHSPHTRDPTFDNINKKQDLRWFFIPLPCNINIATFA